MGEGDGLRRGRRGDAAQGPPVTLLLVEPAREAQHQGHILRAVPLAQKQRLKLRQHRIEAVCRATLVFRPAAPVPPDFLYEHTPPPCLPLWNKIGPMSCPMARL